MFGPEQSTVHPVSERRSTALGTGLPSAACPMEDVFETRKHSRPMFGSNENLDPNIRLFLSPYTLFKDSETFQICCWLSDDLDTLWCYRVWQSAYGVCCIVCVAASLVSPQQSYVLQSTRRGTATPAPRHMSSSNISGILFCVFCMAFSYCAFAWYQAFKN